MTPGTRQCSRTSGRVTAVILLLLALSFTAPAFAQQVVTINWASPNPTPVGAPANINGSVTLSIKITNVNDIIYQYTVNTSVTTAPTDDLANLLALMKPAAAAGSGEDTCADFKRQLGSLQDAIKAEKNLTPDKPASGSSYASIPLSDSLAAWKKLAPLETITKLKTDKPACVKSLDEQTPPAFTTVYNAILSVDARAVGPHETAAQTCVLQPGQQCTVTVYEYYIGPNQINPGAPPAQLTATTTSSGKTFTISPGSNILTLSAGFVATTLAARTYTSTPVPTDPSPVLAVGNDSRLRPGAVALLNYSIPKLDSYQAGLALSAGPLITFGSGGANISTLGFFGGLSLHFWHRLYLTPGFHFGQFADFPKGFVEGTPVPTNIATPTPINRWTSRFAIAITFQTADFSKIGGGNSTTTKTTPAPADQTKQTPNSSAPKKQ